jgi:hypothetical protein
VCCQKVTGKIAAEAAESLILHEDMVQRHPDSKAAVGYPMEVCGEDKSASLGSKTRS